MQTIYKCEICGSDHILEATALACEESCKANPPIVVLQEPIIETLLKEHEIRAEPFNKYSSKGTEKGIIFMTEEGRHIMEGSDWEKWVASITQKNTSVNNLAINIEQSIEANNS